MADTPDGFVLPEKRHGEVDRWRVSFPKKGTKIISVKKSEKHFAKQLLLFIRSQSEQDKSDKQVLQALCRKRIKELRKAGPEDVVAVESDENKDPSPALDSPDVRDAKKSKSAAGSGSLGPLAALECPVCLTQYDEDARAPMTSLECSHTVGCRQCVAALFSNGKARCPICRKGFGQSRCEKNFGLAEIVGELCERGHTQPASSSSRPALPAQKPQGFLARMKRKEANEKVEVPESMVGRIIGSKGVTIKKVESFFGVRVRKCDGGFEIRGEKMAVKRCRMAMESFLYSAEEKQKEVAITKPNSAGLLRLEVLERTAVEDSSKEVLPFPYMRQRLSLEIKGNKVSLKGSAPAVDSAEQLLLAKMREIAQAPGNAGLPERPTAWQMPWRTL